MGTTATILAGLLGAGGSIAGGALSQPENDRAETAKIRGSGILSTIPQLQQDPIAAILLATQLANLGVVQPSLLQNAGPLNQTINALRASGRFNVSQIFDIERKLREAFDLVQSGADIPNTKAMRRLFLEGGSRSFNLALNEAGFGSIEDLIAAEQDYQQQVAPILSNLESFQQAGLERSQLINDALLNLTQSAAAGSDLESLKAAERERLQREIVERRREALQQGNVGGFNPSGTLEALADQETDADLIALQRALALAQGELGVQNNTLALLTGLDPTSINPATTFQPASPVVAGISQTGTNPGGFGTGVANAGLILGDLVGSLAPAAGKDTGSDNSGGSGG